MLFSEEQNERTRELTLSRGLVAIVDEADYEFLSQWKWHATSRNYAARNNENWGSSPNAKRTILLHAVIMNPPEGMVVDHINRNTLDNRRRNLRNVTPHENARNKGVRKNNTSGFVGVHPYPGGLWQVEIQAAGNRKYVGRFKDRIEAAKAYDAAAVEMHGGFAQLNFSREVGAR